MKQHSSGSLTTSQQPSCCFATCPCFPPSQYLHLSDKSSVLSFLFSLSFFSYFPPPPPLPPCFAQYLYSSSQFFTFRVILKSFPLLTANKYTLQKVSFNSTISALPGTQDGTPMIEDARHGDIRHHHNINGVISVSLA